MKKAVSKALIITIMAVMLLTAFCSCSLVRYSVTYTDYFDTITTFTAYCSSQSEFDGLCETVKGELGRLDGIFDVYDSSSEASKLNAERSAEVSDDFAAVLALCDEFYTRSGGALDVTLGKVFSLWHAFRDGGEIPDKEVLLRAKEGTGFENVSFEGNKVSFVGDNIKLDFGAVVKGYAAKRIYEILDCKDFLINIGGDVYAKGIKNTGEMWSVAIENPDGGIILNLRVTDISVVTSGDYQRYVMKDGVRYHHIIDPETCYPSSRFRSVTVIHKDPAIADALSTALFCMSYEDGKALVEKYGAEAFWIDGEGVQYKTPGFGSYEKK